MPRKKKVCIGRSSDAAWRTKRRRTFATAGECEKGPHEQTVSMRNLMSGRFFSSIWESYTVIPTPQILRLTMSVRLSSVVGVHLASRPVLFFSGIFSPHYLQTWTMFYLRFELQCCGFPQIHLSHMHGLLCSKSANITKDWIIFSLSSSLTRREREGGD